LSIERVDAPLREKKGNLGAFAIAITPAIRITPIMMLHIIVLSVFFTILVFHLLLHLSQKIKKEKKKKIITLTPLSQFKPNMQ
jgi:hypothetical protein